ETQSTAHLGKAAKKDAEAGKLTYPQVLGLEGSRAEVRRLEAVALEALRPLGSSAEPLAVLATYMAVRTR
ncbi:MAG: polyprenyl synthetase family protein, partial [Planctomyces sp.]